MASPDTLKQIDVLRHELKALRFILDEFHSGRTATLPPREDFLSEQGRAVYDAIVNAENGTAARDRIRHLDLEDVDVESFLRLSGEHYYTYPALVRERAAAVRSGRLKVESA